MPNTLPPVHRTPTLPLVVGAIIVANVVTFYAQHTNPAFLLRTLALWPLNPGGTSNFEWWQLVTYAFLHGGDMHLFVNLLALWMFGRHLEARWGSLAFLFYYFACVAGAGLVQLGVGQAGLGGGVTVGASGGVFGLLLAFGLMYPNAMVMLLIPPIPMRARTLVIGVGIVTLLMGLTGTMPVIAHFAHLGGMLVGWLVIKLLPSLVPVRPPPG